MKWKVNKKQFQACSYVNFRKWFLLWMVRILNGIRMCKIRRWRIALKKARILVLKTCDDGEIYLDINLSAEYFMGDPSYVDTDTFEPILDISPRLVIEYSQTKGEQLEVW